VGIKNAVSSRGTETDHRYLPQANTLREAIREVNAAKINAHPLFAPQNHTYESVHGLQFTNPQVP
jgi:hypothetical protein